MPVMQLINGDATTTSVNAQTAADAVITPQNWAGFPTTPQFTIRNGRTGELMLVTAVTTGAPNTWTVTRGYGGTAAAAINAGDTLEYSLTREMLLGGFMVKLDEQTLSADSAGPLTLTVPSGLPTIRGFLVRARFQAASASYGNLLLRFGGDLSANYQFVQHYGGNSAGSGTDFNRTLGACAQGGPASSSGSGFSEIAIDGLAEAAWTHWVSNGWVSSGTDGYAIQWNGVHRVATAYSTIQLSLDSAGNVTWVGQSFKAGSLFSLYGVP